jgi:low affinity Fe/Cu permease
VSVRHKSASFIGHDERHDAAKRRKPVEWVFTRFATSASFLAGQPTAFVLAVCFIAVWILTGPIFGWSDSWQLVVNTATTIVTFLMVFVIQNAQNRDAAALQAKLDEVIRSLVEARNEFIGIEHLWDSQIEEIRYQLEREVSASGTGHHSSQSMKRLLARR